MKTNKSQEFYKKQSEKYKKQVEQYKKQYAKNYTIKLEY